LNLSIDDERLVIGTLEGDVYVGNSSLTKRKPFKMEKIFDKPVNMAMLSKDEKFLFAKGEDYFKVFNTQTKDDKYDFFGSLDSKQKKLSNFIF